MSSPVVPVPADGGEAADSAAAVAQIKEQAKNLSDIIAAGMKRENIDQPPPVVDSAAAAAAPTTEEAAPAPVTDDELAEVENLLSEMGLDLGIKAADVPPELRPAYESLVQSAVAVAEDTMRKQLEASEGKMQFEQFKSSVEKSPDRLLLTLAMQYPQLVTKTAELVAEMSTNPQVKDAVLRELEVEMKHQETTRREQLLNEREARFKAQQVISATRRAAREHGVDFDIAEKFVALAVEANGGDLNPNEVAEIVADIKPKAPVARPRVATVTGVAAAKTAPTAAVAAAQAAAPAAISPGLKEGERKHSGSVFRQLVKDAMARVTSGNQ